MDKATHRTTILLTPALHERLCAIARRTNVSMGHLIRTAVEAQYGTVDPDERLAAVRAIGALSLPVDSAEAMKAESVPYAGGVLP